MHTTPAERITPISRYPAAPFGVTRRKIPSCDENQRRPDLTDHRLSGNGSGSRRGAEFRKFAPRKVIGIG